MAPGLCSLVGGRPKVTPCLKLFSYLFPKTFLPANIQLNEDKISYTPQTEVYSNEVPESNVDESDSKVLKTGNMTYKLEQLAHARSGDKGNSCNIGMQLCIVLPFMKLRNAKMDLFFQMNSYKTPRNSNSLFFQYIQCPFFAEKLSINLEFCFRLSLKSFPKKIKKLPFRNRES